MNLIVIDFETYYDRLFSLSKMSTEEYVRSDQFEVIGVSVKENDDEAVWFSGTYEETASFLASYNMQDKFVVGHNMRFDASILSWHFNIHPRGIGDTMGMGQILHGLTESVALKSLSELYGIGQKGTEVEDALGKNRNSFTSAELARYGKYCKNDVELTHKLFYKMLPRMNKQELKLIDLTIRMFTEPKLKINKALLLGHLHNIRRAKETLLANANVEKGELMSNPKFAELLKEMGVEPPMKVSATTGKETFAFAKTDEAFKELLEHENPQVQVLAAARVGNKSTIEESRTEQFIQIANRGLLPVPLKYAGAVVSHRWSGVDGINLQNLPRSSQLRRAICAPDGYKIVAADLSNIELRLAYWFAKSTAKIEQIRNGVDLYRQTASEITGTPYDEVDKDLRFIFKVVNLSGIYGVGANKMHSILKQGGVQNTIDEVKSIVFQYRQSNPELVQAWADAGTMLESLHNNQTYSMGNGHVITGIPGRGLVKPSGMALGLPNLRKLLTAEGRETWAYDKRMGKSLIPEYIHPSKVFQRCIQSLARDIIAEQMVAVARRYKVVLQVHDEIVAICKEDEVDECKAYIEQCMTTAPSWCADLPLGCEVGVGDNYMDAK